VEQQSQLGAPNISKMEEQQLQGYHRAERQCGESRNHLGWLIPMALPL